MKIFLDLLPTATEDQIRYSRDEVVIVELQWCYNHIIITLDHELIVRKAANKVPPLMAWP